MKCQSHVTRVKCQHPHTGVTCVKVHIDTLERRVGYQQEVPPARSSRHLVLVVRVRIPVAQWSIHTIHEEYNLEPYNTGEVQVLSHGCTVQVARSNHLPSRSLTYDVWEMRSLVRLREGGPHLMLRVLGSSGFPTMLSMYLAMRDTLSCRSDSKQRLHTHTHNKK